MNRTMVQMFYDDAADLSVLTGKTIAVIGYGSQGEAQAKCLRDSGVRVILGLRRDGTSWKRGSADGFEVHAIDEAARMGDIIHLLIPDTAQPTVYRDQVRRHLTVGKTLCFSHGFNIHFQTIKPPIDVDVVMVAPKGPGLSVRELYTKGFGVPALIAVQQDPSGVAKQTVLALAKALGATRAGVIETTFKDETESDLIGEQIVLVGGIMELIRNGFEVLVELGYPEELAYFEACNEAKLIIDQIYNNGMLGMLKAVSDTAKYGGLVVGPKVIDSHVRKNMIEAARRVQSGQFARQWLKEDSEGRPIFTAAMKEWDTHSLERVGRVIRSMYGEKA